MYRSFLSLIVLALSASALVVSPDHHVARNSPDHHRVRSNLVQRRALRQKRCLANYSSAINGTPSSDAAVVPLTVAPVNVSPDPTPIELPPAIPSPDLPTPALPVPSPDPPAPSPDQPAAPPPSNNNGDEFVNGQMTFFNVGLGACGGTNVDSDFIAAAAAPLFDTFPGATGNPNQNPICGKQAQITYQGKIVTVSIQDRCPECAHDSLDLSPSAFQQLADFGVGRLFGATWHFV